MRNAAIRKRIISVAMTLIMVFVSYVAMPAKAIADNAEEAEQTEAIEAYADANDFSQDNSLAYSPLVGELREDRDESVKVFRRADGAQEAVFYSDPIHYLKDEAWETIDNTLELVTLEDGTQAYRNKANDFIVSFSPYFNADNLITVESKGHVLSWRFMEELLFAQEESVEETEMPEAEVPEGPEQEEEQPTEEPEESETIVEEAEEEQGGRETPSDETEEPEAEETETPFVEAELPDEDNPEEVPSEEQEETETADEDVETEKEIEPEELEETVEESEAGIEQAYETLKITDAEAETAKREHKEPETDEERDMLLRYPEELTSELTYKDPETGLNVHYVLSGKRLSEQIVLDHAPENAIAYSTLLSTNGLKAEEKDGKIVFVDESGEAIFEIMPPVMYDANGEGSAEIEVRLIETEDGYVYTLIPDEKWLQDETRTYPVVLDPDVQATFAGYVADTYVSSANPNTNYSNEEVLYVSQYASNIRYILLTIGNPVTFNSGDIVLNATVHMNCLGTNINSDNVIVTGHRITEPWMVNTVTYSDMPTYDSKAASLAMAARQGYASDFDITSLYKNWQDNPTSNYGILLKAETTVRFYSSESDVQSSLHPSISIIYRNSTGLESNWTYYSQSAGRAGTGSVNIASGNFTWTFSDGGITNGALPISLSHVYNVNDKETDLGYGYGWRLNYAQSLLRFPVVNGNTTTEYYQYTDGDGTRHYYKEDEDNKYVNELDKDSELTFDGTTATIEDKGGNKLIFEYDSTSEKGRLVTVEDANGNQTLISYLYSADIANLRIASIQEKLSGIAAGQALTLTYDTDDHLVYLKVPNGLNITFDYSVNNDLSSASYTDELSVGFRYVDHRLARATNIDGYNLRYVYNPRNGIRKVTEYAGETRGKGLLFGYGWNKTVITELDINDHSTDHRMIYMTDSLGQPISVTDPEGRAMYAAYNTGEQTVTQLSAVSKLQYTVVNLLKNHGFEQSNSTPTNWTAAGSGIWVSSLTCRDGRYSVKFDQAAAERTLSQTVSVTSGQTYTFSVYFKGAGSGQVKAVTGSSTFTGDLVTANEDDWTRAAVTFTAASNSATVTISVPANSGAVYADSTQLEKAATPNRYNLIENSDFTDGVSSFYDRNHSSINGVVSLSEQEGHPNSLDNSVYRFAPLADNSAYVAQSVVTDGHAGDTYSFGVWMQSSSPAESEQWCTYGQNNAYVHKVPIGVKRLTVEFQDGYGNVLSSTSIVFAVDTDEWQFASGVAVAQRNYSIVRIKMSAVRCSEETLIDGLQLYREEFSQAYSYDSAGNLTGYTTLIGQQNSFDYDEHNNVTSSTDPRGNTTEYTYYDNTHNVKTVETAEHVKSTYTYNTKGQATKVKVGGSALFTETETAYDSTTGLTTSVTDARGNAVSYDYDDDTRQTETITDPKNNSSTYTYGNAAAMHRLVSLTSSGLGVVTYGYDSYGKLETITRGSTIYSLTYDDWNRPEETKVGTVTLSTNTYDDDFRLETVTYANGFSARYEYDDLDRVEKIYQTEGNNAEELTYEMIYNGEGDLYEIRNYRTGRASFFDYDHAGRCMASKERAFTVTNGVITYGAILSSYGYQYDECNNLTKLTCSVLGSSWSTVYTYDGDNRAATTTLSSGKVITNTYDAIGRLTNRALGLNTTYNTALTYVPGNATNKTTGLVATYQNGSDAAYNYEYDAVGNITEITQGSTSISYEYDTANRLIRENNQVTNQTVTYAYDAWGNILNKKVYDYTTGTLGTPTSTVNYAYTNSAWGDQLTSYAGQTITYDEMGNPTTYRGYTMAWRGKQLTSASNGTNSLTFEYNEDGLRQKKTVNNVVTDYFYNGSVLIGMQRGTMKFLFSYDAGGNVVSVKYITANDTNEYYYLRNAQGDIVKLIDANGVSVVEYTYDTWGKKVTTTGSLAGTLGLFQPFRYRGYVYDWETGFYYLQSRYYDPTTGRFISADVLLSTGQGVLGHNCYAYCLGNPGNMTDDGGNRPAKGANNPDGDQPSYSERLKQEIEALFSNSYYSETYWNNASLFEKECIIDAFALEVTNILGMEPCKVVFITDDSNPACLKGKTGDYTDSSRTLQISLRSGHTGYERLKTVIHELRHGYQYDVCAGKISHGETNYTITKWKACFSRYGGHYITYDEDPNGYNTQAIETDARWFAGQDW